MATAEAAEGKAVLLSQYQATTDVEEVDLNLIQALLEFVCGEGQHARQDQTSVVQGAVLVFLPGWLTPPPSYLIPPPPRAHVFNLTHCCDISHSRRGMGIE